MEQTEQVRWYAVEFDAKPTVHLMIYSSVLLLVILATWCC